MSVINTIKWMKKEQSIIPLLKPYFANLSEEQIENNLRMYGMSKKAKATDEWMKRIEDTKILKFLQRHETMLRAKWQGPDIPIFTLPCDEHNQKIQVEYKGRAGVAFYDKLFYFYHRI
ncbi:uncharacterized protein YjaZ [Metabacillus malikii]|uniref:Uncharacterized protein YjaZ n=1 Tax=Metabacillus malikii TaxID=1504265 RepID=A0ABT9ZED1_9BACI|nr:uncharacterized protein YjaZ [Metabacillus malikii]